MSERTQPHCCQCLMRHSTAVSVYNIKRDSKAKQCFQLAGVAQQTAVSGREQFRCFTSFIPPVPVP